MSGIWLPAALVLIVALLLWKADRIALALRAAPFVRSLKIYGVEIQLDTKALEELEEREKQIFQKLAAKMEQASTKTARSLSMAEHLKDAAKEIIEKRKSIKPNLFVNNDVRFTIHVPDTIFKDHVYQLVDYYSPKSGSIRGGRGRRFSVRYGIIGLCWRTSKSRGTATAFDGDENAINDLKERWSMTDADAETAKLKPSCLAVSIRGESPETQLAIVYADSPDKQFWGDNDEEANAFAISCENLGSIKNLRAALKDYNSFLNSVRLDLELTSL